jgi:hypothetical protein
MWKRANARGTTVLHVDGDDGVRADSRAAFERPDAVAGAPVRYEYEAVATADEALARLRRGGVDCLVADGVVTDDGESIVAAARRVAPGLPVVSFADHERSEAALLADASVIKGTADDVGRVLRAVTRLLDPDEPEPGWTVVAHHDWTGAPRPSTTVVTALARYRGRDPTDLPPLFDAVDADALDALLDPTVGRDTGAVETTFRYADELVRVTGDGAVAVAPAPAD